MVYSLDILNTKISEDNQVFVQGGPTESTRSVTVYFNGSGVHEAAGPTPMVELSSNVERNDIGEPLVINNTITVMGKIVKNSGIKNIMSGIKQLKNIFKPDSCGLFQIKCDGSEIYSASGVRFVSLDFNQTSDNWVNTAEYVAKLEYLEPGYTGWYVKSYSDNWNIEPLEDYVYADDKINITHKVENYNPKILPALNGAAAAPPNGATPTASYDIPYRSIPQFKVSRTISAVGIPSGTGSCNPVGSTIPVDKYPALAVSAFYEAKKWVEGRASSVFSSPNTTIPIWNPMGGSGYLYNHLRVVSFDIHAGKYEITDTWLGMPTGISFIEDYTIETTTDDKYIHTVSVQGEIRGLNIANPSITGTPYIKDSGNPIKLDLTSIGTGLLKDKTFAINPTIESNQSNTVSNYQKINPSKYTNALSGWINDVKPYLYRRACIGMNSIHDRTKGYVGTPTNPPQPPNNPIYSKHNILNIIPISTSETHNLKKGSISYNYQFNNKFTIISGVLYENVSMEDTGPTAIVGEAFVLGRALGPVLQSLNTTTSARKTITIELGVVPPTSMNGFFVTHTDCPLWTGGTIYRTVTGMIEGFKPFGDRIANIFGSANTRFNTAGQVYLTQDTQQWEPNSGRYVRTVGWVYQQCTSAKSYLDH